MGHGERILLVEDEEIVRSYARSALTRNGYVVYAAGTAEEALAIFEDESGNFQLAFIDIVLPDKSGISLCEELLSRSPHLNVLLTSGFTEEKTRLEELNRMGVPFLRKPYELSALLRTINESLEKVLIPLQSRKRYL